MRQYFITSEHTHVNFGGHKSEGRVYVFKTRLKLKRSPYFFVWSLVRLKTIHFSMTNFALINLCGFPTNAKLKTSELLQSDPFIYEMLKFKFATHC